jgi:DNA-binding IclR family transcriptional regulator
MQIHRSFVPSGGPECLPLIFLLENVPLIALKKPMRQRISKTKNLDKVGKILRCFTPSEPFWTATALSRKLGIPVTTLHGILADLVTLDFLSQSPLSKEYRVGLRYMEMGFLHVNNFELNNIAHGVMQELSFAVRKIIGLSLVYQGWMYVSTSVLPMQTVRNLRYLGPRLPAHVSAGGMAVLAYLPEEDIRAYQSIDWTKSFPPPSVPESWDMEASLRRIRERGYSVSLIAAESGNPRTIGAPIFGREHQVIAGLVAIESHEGFIDEEMTRVSAKVIAAANEISMHSGHLIRNANCV